mmetsp:Transcript_20612/g.29400  ORF Transcript_20612/g.29400 Transcript_20612/m.29400 type:complete len:85 (+) Transcript_20612:1280-1534(+)
MTIMYRDNSVNRVCLMSIVLSSNADPRPQHKPKAMEPTKENKKSTKNVTVAKKTPLSGLSTYLDNVLNNTKHTASFSSDSPKTR